MKASYVYVCRVCGEGHRKYADAINCCPSIRQGFMCKECERLYEDEEEAEKCCLEMPD